MSTISSDYRTPVEGTVKGAVDYSFIQRLIYPELISSHGEKRPFVSALRERERGDVNFASRMVAARKALAEELGSVSDADSLTKLRLQKGLSQQNLAMLLGTSQSHVAKIEAGKVDIYFGTAIKMADVFGVSLDSLRVLIEHSKRPVVVCSES